MKLDQIFEQWDVDCKINRQELGEEALRISQLHNKYYRIFANERLVLKKYEAELKQLKLAKQEFFILGPTEETHARGWKLPPQGKVLRSDVGAYVDSDPEIVTLTLKIGMQHEKIDLLDSIIRTLRDRNFNIRAAIDWEKFKVGI